MSDRVERSMSTGSHNACQSWTNSAMTWASWGPRSSWRKCPAPEIVTGAIFSRPECAREGPRQLPSDGILVRECAQERPREAAKRRHRREIGRRGGIVGRGGNQHRKLARPSLKGVTGKRRVVCCNDVGSQIRRTAAVDDPACIERRCFLTVALPCQKGLAPLFPVGRNVFAATTRLKRSGLADDSQADQSTPVLAY